MTRPVIAVVGKKVGQEGNKSKRGANDIFVGFLWEKYRLKSGAKPVSLLTKIRRSEEKHFSVFSRA